MAKDTKTWIIVILIAAGVLFLGGMYTQKNYPLFSTVSSSRTCVDWLINAGLPSSSTAPFNWQYTSSQTRCVTALTSTTSGCTITYEAGECPTTPCTESWSCTSWSACSSGTQTRTCSDANTCGTTVSKPATSQSCSSGTGNCLLTDANSNGKVDDSELLQAINRWVTNG